MRRDPDLIRALLLQLEATSKAELFTLPVVPGYETHRVEHHFRLLSEAGLVSAAHTSADGRTWIGIRLTWSGHDYIDQIRDPVIWRRAKKAASTAGSWSIETLGIAARALVMAKLEAMGLSTAA